MQREMLEHVLQKQDSRDLRGALQQQNVSKALSEASRSGDPSNLAELPLAEKLLAQKWVRDLEFDDRPKMLKSLSKALF